MKTIHKIQLTPLQSSIFIPINSKILTVKTQYDIPCIWYLLDSEESSNETRDILIVPTGHIFDDTDYKYVDTFLLEDDNLVFHLFEREYQEYKGVY